MPLYHFKIDDGKLLTDHSVHALPDETAAQIKAIKLARSLRETRADLSQCSIVVTDDGGRSVCVMPIEVG